MIQETETLMHTLLRSDPAGLRSLNVSGVTPEALSITVAAGPIPVEKPYTPYRREIVAGLVQRMQSKRWSAFDDFTLSLPMPTEDELDSLSLKHHAISSVLDVGPGWLWLLDATFAYVHELGPSETWHTTQIKEKFAGLRLYFSGYPGDDGDDAIEASELISFCICDVCGAPGKVRKGGWWATRCDAHAKVAEV
jgi:hypothetical protein